MLFRSGNGRVYNGDDEGGRQSSKTYVNINGREFNMNKWYMKILPFVIMALVVFFVLWVAFGLLHLTVSILTSPVFWVIVLVFMALGYFSRRR